MPRSTSGTRHSCPIVEHYIYTHLALALQNHALLSFPRVKGPSRCNQPFISFFFIDHSTNTSTFTRICYFRRRKFGFLLFHCSFFFPTPFFLILRNDDFAKIGRGWVWGGMGGRSFCFDCFRFSSVRAVKLEGMELNGEVDGKGRGFFMLCWNDLSS